jgi:hypothetical protein
MSLFLGVSVKRATYLISSPIVNAMKYLVQSLMQ